MKLKRKFKDEKFLSLMNMLIDEYPYPGIPIGNRYSPMLANLYLSDLDHRLKETYHVHYLVSFADDRWIGGYSKPWLHRILNKVIQILAESKLTIKPNYQIFPIDSRGIAFLGYRIFTTHIQLLKRTKKKIKRVAENLSDWSLNPIEPLTPAQ